MCGLLLTWLHIAYNTSSNKHAIFEKTSWPAFMASLLSQHDGVWCFHPAAASLNPIQQKWLEIYSQHEMSNILKKTPSNYSNVTILLSKLNSRLQRASCVLVAEIFTFLAHSRASSRTPARHGGFSCWEWEACERNAWGHEFFGFGNRNTVSF